MSRRALRLVVDHSPIIRRPLGNLLPIPGARPPAPVADDAVPPTSSAHDAQGWRTSPAQPCAFNYYLPLSDIVRVEDVVCAVATIAVATYFAAHLGQAIALCVGPYGAMFCQGASL